MRVSRGQLDADLEVWVDATDVRAPGSMQVVLSGPGWEKVFVVRTPEAHDIRLVSRSRLPILDSSGLPASAEAEPRADEQMPSPDTPVVPGRFAPVLSAFTWALTIIATVLAIALATGVLDAQVIQSGSMRPGIKPGDLYVGVSTHLRSPQVGQVAAFTTRTLDGADVAVFVHRIIGVTSSRQPGFVTKGDANPSPEALATTPDDVRSTELFTAPFGGIIVSLRPVVIALLGGLVMLLVLRVRERWRA